MRMQMFILCLYWAGYCVGYLSVNAADESQSPSAVADAITLASRVAELEQRVQALEAAAKPVQAVAAAKPVLWIHSEEWCGPCRVLKADIAAAGELPVEIKSAKFSSYLPGLKWTKADGTTITRTGYTRGTLQSIIDEVVKDSAGSVAVSDAVK